MSTACWLDGSGATTSGNSREEAELLIPHCASHAAAALTDAPSQHDIEQATISAQIGAMTTAKTRNAAAASADPTGRGILERIIFNVRFEIITCDPKAT